jgi:hypothetical protein
MRYGIKPLTEVGEAYVWRFGTLEEAKEAAKRMSRIHNTNVVVFKISGVYIADPIWQEEK